MGGHHAGSMPAQPQLAQWHACTSCPAVFAVLTTQLLWCLVQGNTDDRPARNPRAFDENNAVRLYDETKRILTHKARMTTLSAFHMRQGMSTLRSMHDHPRTATVAGEGLRPGHQVSVRSAALRASGCEACQRHCGHRGACVLTTSWSAHRS
jgi:hypothetical protein